MLRTLEKHDDAPETSRLPIFGILFVFALGFGLAHCWMVKDFVAFSALAVVGLGGAVGYWYGIWKSIGSVAGAFAGFQFAEPAATRIVPLLKSYMKQDISPQMGLAISGILVCFAVTIAFWMIGMIVIRRNTFLNRMDRRVGFVAGLLNSFAVVAVLLWGLLASESAIAQLRLRSDSPQASALAAKLDDVVVATKKSYVMIGLSKWNPFVDSPYVRDLKKKIEAIVASRSGANLEQAGAPGQLGVSEPTLEQLLSNPLLKELLGDPKTGPMAVDGAGPQSGELGALIRSLNVPQGVSPSRGKPDVGSVR